MRAAGLFLLLASCQGTDNSERDRLTGLEARVEKLEERSRFLEQRMTEAERPRSATTSVAQPMTYELEGQGGHHQYATEAKCEAARQVLLSDRATDDETSKAQGVVFTNRPMLSCIPI